VNSLIELTDVYAEIIFECFYTNIVNDGGDGAGVICCGNPAHTSDEFIKWFKKKFNKDRFFHEGVTTNNDEGIMVNYHDSNENFMFCNYYAQLPFGDITYLIKEDCKNYKGSFKILRCKVHG